MNYLIGLAACISLLSIACQPLSAVVSMPDRLQEAQMTQAPLNLPFSLNATLLEVYEDQTAPPGTPPGHDRAIGHAIVRLRLENLTQTPVNFEICSVAIQSEQGQPTLMAQAVGNLELGGLQIVERGFHLTQTQGFGDVSRVQAIVTYRYNSSTYTTKSPAFPVTVNR